MNSSDAAFERAEELAEREREAGIKAASDALARPGSKICVACDNSVGELRLKLMPSATRCFECQTIFETEQAAG